MNPAKVYYTDLRTHGNDNLPKKLQRLIRTAGIGNIDMEKKFVAIKLHFGEPGNLSFLAAELCQGGRGCGEGAGRHSLFDRLQHPVCGPPRRTPWSIWSAAYENGFSPLLHRLPDHHRQTA